MSSLVYYSISSDLTKDEILEIDKQVSENLEKVNLLVRKLFNQIKIYSVNKF